MYGYFAKQLALVLENGNGTHFFYDTMDLIKGENSVLGHLFKVRNGASIGELQQAAHVGSGRISDLVKQLVKKNYVFKKKDPYDQRSSRVYITQEGIAFINKQYEIIFSKMSQSLKNLSIDEVKTFIDLIRKIV